MSNYFVTLCRKTDKGYTHVLMANEDINSRLIAVNLDLSPEVAKRLALALLKLSDRPGKIHLRVMERRTETESGPSIANCC
jgi:hypothetical protein